MFKTKLGSTIESTLLQTVDLLESVINSEPSLAKRQYYMMYITWQLTKISFFKQAAKRSVSNVLQEAYIIYGTHFYHNAQAVP